MADTGRVEQGEQVKLELHASLRRHRAHILASVENLTEAQLRRPMTPTGTNLLGLVKHLAGLEYGYLGGVFGRPGAERLSWVDDKSIWDGADMWATAEESSDYLIGLYRRACAHADQTIDALGLDSPGSVSWWAETQRSTTLLTILLRMVGETAQHAGHADIVRELVDGRGGADQGEQGDDQYWRDFRGRIAAAAATFETDGTGPTR